MASKTGVITNFKLQTGKYTKTSNGRYGGPTMYYESCIFYSYGHHFPLAIRHEDAGDDGAVGFGEGIKYIINGDKYSSSTSSHQREVIQACTPNVQVPFSALEQAWNWAIGDVHSHTVRGANQLAMELEYRGEESQFKIINYTQDTWTHWYRKDSASEWVSETNGGEAIWSSSYNDRRSDHRLGAVLFTIRNHSFLSSFDNQDRSNYFLCQVPGSPSTVEEAYENLKPTEVKLAEIEGMPILRQGDWFFCQVQDPHNDLALRVRRASPGACRSYRLGGAAGTHVATEARLITPGELVVSRGFVRHAPLDNRHPEHKRLKLGDGKSWWIPVKNTSEAGWGAVGNVD